PIPKNMINKESPHYKWFVLGSLTLVYMFNFIDRQVIIILQEPIKADLGLSDTQIGMMTGLAFAALYVVLGVPIARLADKSNRKNIISASLVVWSAMTVLSGRAMNFPQMLLTRIGVGIGEAGCTPPAHSIISDYFPPEKRATAISVYTTGIYLGILVGFLIGGFVAKLYGWRAAFYLLGIAGIIFAAFFYFTVKEPIRGHFDQLSSSTLEEASLKEVIYTLFSKKTFVYLSLATGFQAFYSYGTNSFLPSFLNRIHDIELLNVSIILGLAVGIGGGIGAFLSGFLADRFRHKDLRWYLWIPMLGCFFNMIPCAFLYFSDNTDIAVAAIFFIGILSPMYIAPSIAVSLSLVNAQMRAFTSAIYIFVLNFIGLGFGPLIVGFISDVLTPKYGALSLRWAFAVTFIPVLISILLFYIASTHYVKDFEAAENKLV
ncbi:MAG: spinster family MFS transporter, partial [Chitinophagales bacterium]